MTLNPSMPAFGLLPRWSGGDDHGGAPAASVRSRMHPSILAPGLWVRWLLVLAACWAGTSPVLADEAGGDGNDRIVVLINHVRSLKGATFIRNGSEYDSKSAATFLKRKWEANRKEIATPAQFIQKVATKSGTTGKPYIIRFEDGSESPCGPYLAGLLKKLEAKPPVEP